MPLNSNVAITDTGIHGHCWFAGEDIKAGEWIWKKRAPGESRNHCTRDITWLNILILHFIYQFVSGAANTDLFMTRAQIAAMVCFQIVKQIAVSFTLQSHSNPKQ
jgi:hypothetical protein